MVACATGTLPLTAVPPSIFGGSPRTLPTGADAAGGTAVTSKFYELRDNLEGSADAAKCFASSSGSVTARVLALAAHPARASVWSKTIASTPKRRSRDH
jgi:hypothetical protein